MMDDFVVSFLCFLASSITFDNKKKDLIIRRNLFKTSLNCNSTYLKVVKAIVAKNSHTLPISSIVALVFVSSWS